MARACGGTFCSSTPVDQTGETILFVLDGDDVEAHIQVQFDGTDASRFSWIVPVPAVPEVEVGSWDLVDAVLDATVPRYGYTVVERCDEEEDIPPSGFITMSDGGGGPGPGPKIVEAGSVGSLDYAVLSGGTTEGVVTWLQANAYVVDPEAVPILDEYLDGGSLFLAFKLTPGAGAEDIHPVVIRYPGTEACIPIRLTRIAAKDDMPIRAVFLGDERVFPQGYRLVELNRTRLNWFSRGGNYDELVSKAIDEAGGRAFVTEYAGKNYVDRASLDTTELEQVAVDLESQSMLGALARLRVAELVVCDFDKCIWRYDMLASLLHEWIPVPPGLTDEAFYACPNCFADQVDTSGWDAPAFAGAFVDRIVAPMQHGRELLETWPYVTRLYTRISPHEMTADPRFVERSEFGDVPNLFTAEQHDRCCGSEVRIPGGRRFSLEHGQPWNWGDTMPWAERIYEVPLRGDLVTIADRSAEIDAIVAAHNAGLLCLDDPTSPDTTGAGPGMGGSAGGTTGDGAPAVDGDRRLDDGCACSSGGDDPWRQAWLLAVVVVGIGRRK